MKRVLKRLLAGILAVSLSLCGAMGAAALSWDGSAAGGGGEGSAATTKGFSIRYADVGTNCLGYRFSVVDKYGNTKNGLVLDVFRNTKYGNSSYTADYKFSTKYNKKQLILYQNSNFSTVKTSAGCVKETDMGFATSLPTPDGMGSWQDRRDNLNPVLYNLGFSGGISSLVNGDKVLVEPLFDVRLETIYHSVTVTELAIYGKWLLGANSNGGSSSNSDTWGFISNYTNRHYPNSLYTPDGQGLWTGASALSGRATFNVIINSGYGVGIAYAETKPDFSPTLSVQCCEVWRGDLSARTYHYGTSNGAYFGNYSYINGYPIMGDKIWGSIYFPPESQDIRVRQSVRLAGGYWASRNVTLSSSSSSSQWLDVSLQPPTVDAGRSCYVVEAKQDWLDSSGNVQKSGTVKTFYIPVKPKVNLYQATMYDVTGSVAARAGAGSTGALYVGQRVRPYYTYTSDNTWTSYNHFQAYLYGWVSGSWRTPYAGDGPDLSLTYQGISSGTPVSRYSNLGLYTVPDNSGSGSNQMRIILSTQWASDPNHTGQGTTLFIPIFKADAELANIRMITEDGYYTSTLWTGEKYTPQYTYKNNTGVRILVEGYNPDGSKIGLYAIPANGSINVNGKAFTAPTDSSTYAAVGSVYLEGAGFGNTQYESNGSNNAKTVTFPVKVPVSIESLTPNSLYREGVSVVTSFRVKNAANANLTPTDKVSVCFRVYKGGTQLYTATKNDVVIPANGDNLVYFKWLVPSGLSGSSLTLQGEISVNGTVYHTDSMTHGTEQVVVSQTPDTVFEKRPPSDFRLISPPSRSGLTTTQWSEWIYENRTFIKKTYGLTMDPASKPVLTPDPDSPSRQYQGGKWTMKSGYGYTVNWPVTTKTGSGLLSPPAAAITPSQDVRLYFPEFQYGMTLGQYRTLDAAGTNTFVLPVNPNADNDRLHFVPLWYPDGDYTVQGYAGDLWTPVGMMSGYLTSDPITIKESAYDDWYVGQ